MKEGGAAAKLSSKPEATVKETAQVSRGTAVVGWARVLINFFIIWNIAAVTIGSTKIITTPEVARRFFFPYLYWTRLLQGWLLFVPTPRFTTSKFRVDVTFQDGKIESWRRPYPPNWDFFQRHLSYQYQKWDLASDSLTSSEAVKKDFARFVLRMKWNEINPPVLVEVVCERAEWPAPHPTGYAFHEDRELVWHNIYIGKYQVKDKGIE